MNPATTSRFICIKIFDYNAKKFGYNEHPLPLAMNSFFCIFLLVVSGTQCTWLRRKKMSKCKGIVSFDFSKKFELQENIEGEVEKFSATDFALH